MATPDVAEPAVALVTGASRGLGRGIAVDAGARRPERGHPLRAATEAAAEETAAACRGWPRAPASGSSLVAGDVGAGRRPRAASWPRPWPRWGGIDALVNNAGMRPARARRHRSRPPRRASTSSSPSTSRAPTSCRRLVARHWLDRTAATRRLPGGYKLVFVSSISAYTRLRSTAATTASPRPAWPWPPSSGPRAWPREGVQVFEVRPGIMATDMTAGVKEKYDKLIAEGLVPQRPLGHRATTWAAAVAALLKGDFPFSTGDVHQRRRRHPPAEALDRAATSTTPSPPETLLPAVRRAVRAVRGRRSTRLEKRWNPAQGTPGLHRARRLHEPRLDRVDAGLPVRRRRSCSSTPPATQRFLEIGRARHRASAWPRTSPTSACTTTASTTSAPTATCCACMREGRLPDDAWERRFYELALKVSGAVQAARWTPLSPEPRLHLLLQRPALAVRGHDPLAARAGGRAPAGPRADGRGRPAHLAAGARCCSTPRPPRASTSTSARAATPTTCAAGWPTSRSST